MRTKTKQNKKKCEKESNWIFLFFFEWLQFSSKEFAVLWLISTRLYLINPMTLKVMVVADGNDSSFSFSYTNFFLLLLFDESNSNSNKHYRSRCYISLSFGCLIKVFDWLFDVCPHTHTHTPSTSMESIYSQFIWFFSFRSHPHSIMNFVSNLRRERERKKREFTKP